MASRFTYLLNEDQAVIHSWNSNYLPYFAVYALADNTILRLVQLPAKNGSATVGGVQRMAWDGTILWDYRYDKNGVCIHHDIEPLPNGNVLIIAWETKTYEEALQAGRKSPGSEFLPEHIIEVRPTGPTTGQIVWEWHVWDHLVQDYDPAMNNYGVVANHPELVDINFGGESDFMHANSVDYHPEFDQILISVLAFSEVWVIDHSTTTAQAAGHTGGRYGHGGDLLYRWGNPQAYKRGTADTRRLYSQHDASWIQEGRPGAGDILVFNNGVGRGYSTVDQITPPVSAGFYYLAPGEAYGPTAITWSYLGTPPTSFYATHLSGAERLPNGNTLVCHGEKGQLTVVNPSGTTLWEYTYGSVPPLNYLFKACYIPTTSPAPEPDLDCVGSLSWTGVTGGQTLTGSFEVRNLGESSTKLNWTVNASSLTWGEWTFVPDSGTNLGPSSPTTVSVTVVAPAKKKTTFEAYIKVENTDDPTDFDIVPVVLQTSRARDYDWPAFGMLSKVIQEFIEHLWLLWEQRAGTMFS
jgi:hypothetical protein